MNASISFNFNPLCSSSSSKASSTPPPPVAVVRPQMEFANFKFPESGGGGASGGVGAKEEGSSLPDNSTEPCDREIQVFDLEAFGQVRMFEFVEGLALIQ